MKLFLRFASGFGAVWVIPSYAFVLVEVAVAVIFVVRVWVWGLWLEVDIYTSLLSIFLLSISAVVCCEYGAGREGRGGGGGI